MRALFSLCLGAFVLAMVGCGGESAETGEDAGGPCESASDCKSGLLCLIQKDGAAGECTAIPTACGEEAKCSSDCLDEVKMSCTSGGSACISVGANNVTITCSN